MISKMLMGPSAPNPQPQPCYWSELATAEKAVFAFEPISRSVPMTTTRMAASITAYSAMSCARSSAQSPERMATEPPSGRGLMAGRVSGRPGESANCVPGPKDLSSANNSANNSHHPSLTLVSGSVRSPISAQVRGRGNIMRRKRGRTASNAAAPAQRVITRATP